MDSQASTYKLLEEILLDTDAEPTDLPLPLLMAITNNFSADRKIGSGGFGVVYMGILRNGQLVAVKKLNDNVDVDEKKYSQEIDCLMRVKHTNIVRFLGYCADTQGKMCSYGGKFVMADVRQRLLCFEFLSNQSLREYITDASCGLEWGQRYQIIKGICNGLHYLHMERIVHLDLKPANILLNHKMEPKITDFGLSRRFGEEQSRAITSKIFGSPGYLAPESFDGVMTFKSDIYSLGVIIQEILTGQKSNFQVERVLESWRNRLGISSLTNTQLKQIEVCSKISINCKHNEANNRPDIESIIKMLDIRNDMSTSSAAEILESWNTRLGTPLEDRRLEQVQACAEIGIKCLDSNPAKKPDTRHIIEAERENMNLTPQIMELNILEGLVAGNEVPCHLDLRLLQIITDNFSEKNRIGSGGCGDVYKGILRNGVVVVKRLFHNRTVKSKMFHREVNSMIVISHENIVRFLGYCSVTEERAVQFGGQTIMADIRERLLCFEYISNGSLDKHLTDELRGLEWHTRYEIIVGVCKGLLYLHKEKNIIHMDLKPANILLDDRMVPKISNFGLFRLDINISHTTTTSRLISPGYCAPEYKLEGISTSKSDIYSLGVMIIEVVTGSTKEPDLCKVLRRWRHRWIRSSKHTPLEQVKKCLVLAQRCMQIDPTDRPDILDIMDELNAINMMNDQFEVIPPLEDMLGIEPLEIHFPFELDPQISHSIELTNDTDDHIAYMTEATLRHFCIEPDKGIVPPRSKCTVTIKMQAQVKEHELPNNHYKEKITMQSTIVDGGLAAMDITRDVFIEKKGTVVDEVNVMVVFDKPPSAEES